MIKKFDKQNLKELRTDLDAAMATIAKKHGLHIQLKNINYYAPDFIRARTTLEFTVVGDASLANDPRAAALVKSQADFKFFASSFGLKPEQYGATFKFGRETYKLVGLNGNAPKNPIHGALITTGKVYRMPESAIASLQSTEHKKMFGIGTLTPTVSGMCSNDNAYDEKYQPIGKCNRPATTSRKEEGFGLNPSRTQPYCAKCAEMIDEARAENAAEARCS